MQKLIKKEYPLEHKAELYQESKLFYKYLILEDYIKVNPTELIESPKIGIKLPDTLSISEIDSLISANRFISSSRRKK